MLRAGFISFNFPIDEVNSIPKRSVQAWKRARVVHGAFATAMLSASPVTFRRQGIIC